MASILNYNKGLYSTKEYRDKLLGRNLPLPVNETLTESGLVSKLEDIGNVINVPINGTASENIQSIYNEEERMFPLGNFFRLTNNVNLNSYIPQNDEYITYELTIPPNLGFPLPEGFGQKDRSPYPFSYNPERFFILGNSSQIGVENPLNVIDDYKSYNFNTESSLGLIGGQELEKGINEKISYVREQNNTDTPTVGSVTLPNSVDDYINIVRGNKIYTSILTNNDVGWNEYNESTKNNSESNLVSNIGGVVRTTSTESRVNTLLEKTSEKQVSFLLELLERNNYRPLYEDRRFQGTNNEGSNGRYYIGSEINTNRGSFIPTTFNEKDFNDVSGGGTVEGQATTIDNDYYWGDGLQILNFNEKTLLSKTKNLVDNYDSDVYINQTQKFFKDKKLDRLISRGSGIGVTPNPQLTGDYARAWTVTDNYNYSNAIRNKGLFTSENGTKGFSSTNEKSSLSVLLDNGFPKVHPTSEDSETTKKKFMFSIENLAWADNLADLPLSEVGPGDLLSKNKGRIMWFPPYALTFDETTNASWTTTDFIGRGEPIYTYNSSSRSGSISFKMLVDHPRVINCYRGKSDNLIERFNAGTVSPETFLSELECSVPQTDLEEIKKLIQEKKNPKENKIEKKKKNINVPVSINSGGTFDIQLTSESINSINDFIKNDLSSESKVTIECTGYLDNTYDTNTDSRNKTISKKMARETYDLIIAGLTTDVNIKKVNKKIIGKGVLGGVTRVSVNITNDVETNELLDSQGKIPDNNVPQVINLIDNLIIDENQYFDFIDDNYPNYFDNISEKIQYFQPGFHSITPEGFNSRLTFLNQCMRQGPSVFDRKTNVNGDEIGVQPQNLSFGRPPICILRIGDFFNTKVVINTLSITYDGPQFDFNPEGIGVQPMIATVTLSINYIGGNSLIGPINRLQNAVSFNYYANTEIYDVRSDSISNDGKLIDGVKLGELKRQLLSEEQFSNYLNNLKEDVPLKQDGGEGGDDSTDGLIEISTKNEGNVGKITIKTKDGIKPSEVRLGKETNPNNKLEYKIFSVFTPQFIDGELVLSEGRESLSGEGDEKNEFQSTDSDSITKNVELKETNGLRSPTELEELQKTLKTQIAELKVLQLQFKNKPDSDKRREIKEQNKKIKTTKESLEKQKDNRRKIKVIARFSERPKRTKVVKVFTITENGLE